MMPGKSGLEFTNEYKNNNKVMLITELIKNEFSFRLNKSFNKHKNLAISENQNIHLKDIRKNSISKAKQ